MNPSGSNNHRKQTSPRNAGRSFYRGVVVKNYDPLSRNRVKVFIPDVTNQPNDDWFEEFEIIKTKIAGTNFDFCNFKDTEIFEEIAALSIWAEACHPIMGESGHGRYNKGLEKATISDSNYPESFESLELTKEGDVLKGGFSVEDGSFAPALLYDLNDYNIRDAYLIGSEHGKCNPYGIGYHPNKSVNMAKGSFSTPEVGSKVWIFFEGGDYDYPVYFGTYRDTREMIPINNVDNVNGDDLKTSKFEN
jgi:hypothetical protein